jgi:hypothetical protein
MENYKKLIQLLKSAIVDKELRNSDDEVIDRYPVQIVDDRMIAPLAAYLHRQGVYTLEWVSVKERLPDESGTYLVIGKSGTPHTSHFYKQRKIPSTEFAVIPAHFSNRYVRFWMPLPTPPEEVFP